MLEARSREAYASSELLELKFEVECKIDKEERNEEAVLLEGWTCGAGQPERERRAGEWLVALGRRRREKDDGKNKSG